MAHIQKRGPSRYKVRYRGPDGKERSKTYSRKGDADRFAATVEADRARGAWVDPDRGRRHFSEYAKVWYSTLDAKPKTKAGYKSILNRWLLPAFGSHPVEKVSWLMIERFKADMVEANKTSQTIKNVLNVLRTILDAAVRDGALVKNPADEVRSPRVGQSQRARFESADTIVAFVDTMAEVDGLHVLFAAFTGLRAGECAALRVEDIDLMRGRLTVHASVSEVGGKVVFTTTKNNSTRSVAIPHFLCDRLAAHLERRGVAKDPRAMVFTSPNGEVLRHSNFYRRVFKPAAQAFGLGDFRFHDLRHTCAAMLIAQGAHPRAVMERLGHSSIKVTLDTYGHLFPALDESLTEGLEEQFQEAISSKPRPLRGLNEFQRSA